MIVIMLKDNFNTWLNSQQGLDLPEMVANGIDVASDAELIANGLRPENEGSHREDCAEFAIRVKTFITLLQYGLRDIRVLEDDWKSFKPICEVLIKKKQMDKTILDQF
jgi:hypothetical protein